MTMNNEKRLLSFLEASSKFERQNKNNHCYSSKVGMKITLLERVIRTHPIWFIPEKTRQEAEKLLIGTEEGTFLVRKSSLPLTLALSVQLSNGFVDHYLIVQIKINDRLQLESSTRNFDNILSLVYHYITNQEDIPIRLTLPESLRDTSSRQHLISMARMGQDFWLCPRTNNSSHIFENPETTLPDLLQATLLGLQDLLNNSSEELQKRRRHSNEDTYYRNSVSDKVSDYEDVWNEENEDEEDRKGSRRRNSLDSFSYPFLHSDLYSDPWDALRDNSSFLKSQIVSKSVSSEELLLSSKEFRPALRRQKSNSRKISCGDLAERKKSFLEVRLSSVFCKSNKKMVPCNNNNWQVHSSSWEFLHQNHFFESN